MDINGWKYYKHAAIPSTPPHEKVNEATLYDGSIWKIGPKTLFARWTYDFDCGEETEWWYTILDQKFDINSIKSKRRSEINKGLKNFEVKRVDPCEYKEGFYEVTVAAYSTYPEEYRPTVDKEQFYDGLQSLSSKIVYAAFSVETGEMASYAWLSDEKSYYEFVMLKSSPAYEKQAVNAAIVYRIVEDCADKFGNDNFYICDGERNLVHQTAFPAYLEKYFTFRKAYCRLNLMYRFPLGIVVSLLYPFRSWFRKRKGRLKLIGSILFMEEAKRHCAIKGNQ